MLLFKGRESHPRSFVKAVTWRTLGSLDTFVLSLLVTGNFAAAGAIASAETVTKVFLYYAHERAWGTVRWGQPSGDSPPEGVLAESGVRPPKRVGR